MKKILIYLLTLTLALFSAVHYVDSAKGNDAFGGTQMGPWEHISYAISQAAATDTLMLSGTFYLGQDSGTTTNGIEITKSLTIIGEGAKSTFVKASATPGIATTRVFQVNIGFVVTLKSLSVENGVGINGGGIFSRGTLTLENVNISSNQASNTGGGIGTTGTLNMKNSTIHSNTALNSGGGISGNYGFSNAFNIENCTLSGNQTTAENSTGGGIDLSALNTSRNVTITANINSSTIAGNTASKNSGNGIATCTITDLMNSSTINLTISNSIFSNGSNGNYLRDVSQGGFINLNRSFTLCSDATMPNGTSDGNVNSVDPLLDTLADNGGQTLTHATLWGSPAIESIAIGDGTGDYNGAPLTDQRNIAISRTNKDIGSYEYNDIGTFYVNSLTGDDTTGDGSESNPWLNIGKAINTGYILEGDVIDATGTFYMDQDPYVNQFVANGYVIGEVDRNVIIHGQGADQTVIKACPDGQQAESRLFLILDGYGLTLRDISLQNGYGSSGGGIQARGDLTLERVMISDCETIANQSGGAIWMSGGALNILNSTIYNNTASDRGGALYLTAYNKDITVNITNSTFSNNISGSSGGAMYFFLRTLDETYYSNLYLNIISSTFADNIDIGGNGSFLVYTSTGWNCEYYCTFKNTIISNYGKNSTGIYSVDRTYTICNDASFQVSGAGNVNNADCLLFELADYGGSTLTHALMEGSPAVDAIPESAGGGNYNGAPLLDQRGYSRVNANRDIGSFEGSIPYTLSTPEWNIYEWDGYIYWLSWRPVERATNYAIYSSTEPYGTFNIEWVTDSSTLNWDKTVNFDRSWFFTVTAIDTTRSKGIPHTIEIK